MITICISPFIVGLILQMCLHNLHFSVWHSMLEVTELFSQPQLGSSISVLDFLFYLVFPHICLGNPNIVKTLHFYIFHPPTHQRAIAKLTGITMLGMDLSGMISLRVESCATAKLLKQQTILPVMMTLLRKL